MIPANLLGDVLQARTTRAAFLGDAAFQRGAKRVPALDPGVRPLLADLAVGQGAVLILDAWLRAWDAANLSAPIPPEVIALGHAVGVCICDGF